MSEAPGGWVPICDGELADELRTATLAIARELRQTTFADPALTGAGGAAVMYSYLSRIAPEWSFDDAIDPLIDGAMESVARRPISEGLFGGFAGFAWCLEHVVDCDDIDPNEQVDEALVTALAVPVWRNYDLIGGLAGIGVYALERLPRRSGSEILRLVIDRLSERAEHRKDGAITWWTDPEFIGVRTGDYPQGYYNLGMAHGVPGVVGMLGRACSWPELAPRARPLLDGAVQWLLQQRLAGGQYGALEGEDRPTRCAWCYGEPSVAAALLLAARSVGVAAWERAAIEICLAATSRDSEGTGAIDAGLCHGTAGLAHVFNRFYQATSEPRFADAARFWYRQTLALRKPGSGVAGFVAYGRPARDADRCWWADPGFLTGAAGTALAMIAAVTTVEPNWDRALLCSIPVRSV